MHYFFIHNKFEFIPSELTELWVRCVTVSLLIVFTIILSFLIKKKITLSEELRLFKRVLHAIQEGCVITNKKNEIIYVNPRFEKISGYSFDEVVGKNPKIVHSGKQDKLFYQTLWSSLLKNGYWEGEILNRNKSGELYPEWIFINVITNNAGTIEYYVATFSDITLKKVLEEKMKHYAYYDALTNLPNRRFLTESLKKTIQEEKRRQEKMAIIFIDLDNFKSINDQYGHSVGDKFLCEVAKHIRLFARKSDIVSRFGGDEFVLLLQNIKSKETVQLLANTLLSNLEKNYIKIDANQFKIQASIGFSVYPDDAEEAEMLIKYADMAMYQVKKTTRHAVMEFNKNFQERASPSV